MVSSNAEGVTKGRDLLAGRPEPRRWNREGNVQGNAYQRDGKTYRRGRYYG